MLPYVFMRVDRSHDAANVPAALQLAPCTDSALTVRLRGGSEGPRTREVRFARALHVRSQLRTGRTRALGAGWEHSRRYMVGRPELSNEEGREDHTWKTQVTPATPLPCPGPVRQRKSINRQRKSINRFSPLKIDDLIDSSSSSKSGVD